MAETWIVCGGRTYTDAVAAFGTLDGLAVGRGTPLCIVTGGATGADDLGYQWATVHRVPFNKEVRAEWRKHGKKAGPIRNQLMLDRYSPTLVVAFPGGTGTADMVRRAKAAGVEVIEVPNA